MIHYTCDMCGRRIDPEKDSRYKVEITVEMKSGIREDEQEEMDEEDVIRFMLEEEEAVDIESLYRDDRDFQNMSYDLCGGCQKSYVKNPLFRNVRGRFGFSEN